MFFYVTPFQTFTSVIDFCSNFGPNFDSECYLTVFFFFKHKLALAPSTNLLPTWNKSFVGHFQFLRRIETSFVTTNRVRENQLLPLLPTPNQSFLNSFLYLLPIWLVFWKFSSSLELQSKL